MAIEVIGPHPFERDATGRQKTRIGTVFPFWRTLVTLPGIHATQCLAFVDLLNETRGAASQPPLTPEEEEAVSARSVDLIFETDQILIRPDPEHMELAFEADELLAELVSKRDIRFLFVMNSKVRDAIKARGECWRISPLPQSPEDMRRLIENSKVAIKEQPIYFYNRFTGSRYVTCAEFARLENLDAGSLARQLQEIAVHCDSRNREGSPEVEFFAVDPQRFGTKNLPRVDFASLAEADLRRCFQELRARFCDAVGPDFRQDDPWAEVWRNRMLSALISQRDRSITEDVLRDLSPEFFMQVEWLPGGRFEEGEFVFDPFFDEADGHPYDEKLQRLCDPLVEGFIFNLIREYVDLEYVNIGRITQSLSKRQLLLGGRRAVYLAELKVRGAPAPIVRFIRFQKWGIRERLDEGKPLLQAILESEEYTDYVLDRRLGVLQLGMNVPPGLSLRRTRERYTGVNRDFHGQLIPVIYFERDYLNGLATDKLPLSKYLKPGYAERLAGLLGRAAAANIIVGRAVERTKQVMFDDGDEVIWEDPATGLPAGLIVSDPTGAFSDYRRGLLDAAAEYARPVNVRAGRVARPREFADTYLQAFREEFLRIQGDYRKRRRAFDTLFKHGNYDTGGSFAYRWECVLRRLDRTDIDALVAGIRRQIKLPPDGIST
jgi:hypothetical protein